MLLEQPLLVEALATVISNTTPVSLNPVAAYKLASMGIVTLEGYQARISCDLYRNYFKQTLSHSSLHGASVSA